MKMKPIPLWNKNCFNSFLFFSFIFLLFSCKKDDNPSKGIPYDPSKPVTIEKFTPDSGGVSTQMLIYGSNFGTDASLIKVFVNEKQAPVINSNGNVIYALVPSRADTGLVKVVITNGKETKEVTSTTEFKYIYKPIVSTLAGSVDKDGKSSITDGPIDVAQFENPTWVTFDKDKNIYILEESRGLRYIDAAFTTVATKFRTGNGIDRLRTMAFNPAGDTMYITNDDGDINWNGIGTIVTAKSTNFTHWTPMIHSRQCNGGDAQPQTGDYFFNSYEHGQIMKWNKTTLTWKELFRIGDNGWEFAIQFAPSGNFAYIVVKNQHYILKSTYNRTTGELETPVNFVGVRGTAGYQDGVGIGAQFNQPFQGAFDENDNFYVADSHNHCIRKITPEGIVSTFAGRPNQPGYTDGALRDAQFNEPWGIAYDIPSATFVIADRLNKRIRKIVTE